MKKLFLNIFFTLVIFSLFLVVLEIFFRSTHAFGARISWSTPDPVIGWRFTPGQKFWVHDENDRPVRGRVNRHGWNDRDWSAEKGPGGYRVAVLGDSYVEGLQVERERHFVHLAERQLNAGLPSPRFELMNFGRSGFTQSEEWLVLQNDIAPFSPDLVVLFFFPPNDIMDVHPDTAIDPIRPYFMPAPDGTWTLDTSFKNSRSFRFKTLINPLKHHSALVSLITEKYSIYKLKKKATAKGLLTADSRSIVRDRLTGYLSLATGNPDPVYARNYGRWNKELLRRMADFCRARGIRMMLAVIDTPDYVPEMEEELRRIAPDFKSFFYEDDLGAFAQANGLEFLGLQRPFRQHYAETGKPLHWGDWKRPDPTKHADYLGHSGHWNYAGHERVAQLLADKVRRIAGREGPP